MLPYLTAYYGNPHSRTHAYGWESEAAVERARQVSLGAPQAGRFSCCREIPPWKRVRSSGQAVVAVRWVTASPLLSRPVAGLSQPCPGEAGVVKRRRVVLQAKVPAGFWFSGASQHAAAAVGLTCSPALRCSLCRSVGNRVCWVLSACGGRSSRTGARCRPPLLVAGGPSPAGVPAEQHSLARHQPGSCRVSGR